MNKSQLAYLFADSRDAECFFSRAVDYATELRKGFNLQTGIDVTLTRKDKKTSNVGLIVLSGIPAHLRESAHKELSALEQEILKRNIAWPQGDVLKELAPHLTPQQSNTYK